jgi:mannose-1-phosphate guanylyltransferase
MLPIVNRPFLEYQFELLKKHGITDVILCVAYLPHEFENYFGTGKKWGLKLHYVHEQEPLGTGGAIRNAIDHIDGPTLIFNGDILSDLDLTAMYRYHREKKSVVTIALARVKDPTMYGLIETAKTGKIERFLEKPSWDEITCNTINAGMYIFEPEVLKFIPHGVNFSVERGLFPNLLSQDYGLYGFSSNAYWLDIGTVDKFLQAHHDLMAGQVVLTMPGKKNAAGIRSGKKLKMGKNIDIAGNLVCGDNVTIEDFVQIQGNVCLGNNVKLGKGSCITDSVVLDGTKVAEGVRMDRVLIGRNCTISANATLDHHTTLGDGTTISKYSKI